MPRKRKTSVSVPNDVPSVSTVPTVQIEKNQSKGEKRIIEIRGTTTRWLIILFIAIAASFGFGFMSKNFFLSSTNNGGKPSDVIKRVSSRIYLPEDEVPTVAVVSDKSKLKQPFFARAENGDQVLIYARLKKAVLYRPSIDKIIEYGAINTGGNTAGTTVQNPSPTSQPTVTPTPKVITVAIYNGTGVAGLAAKTEQRLKSSFPQVVVVKKENASNLGYATTTVVDISGVNDKMAKEIAESIKGEVQPLPAGEKKPSADILIIASD